MPGDSLPPPTNYWILHVAILNDDIYPIRAETEQAAVEMSKQVNEFGFWTGLRYYPAHRIDYMEIIMPGQKTKKRKKNG